MLGDLPSESQLLNSFEAPFVWNPSVPLEKVGGNYALNQQYQTVFLCSLYFYVIKDSHNMNHDTMLRV